MDRANMSNPKVHNSCIGFHVGHPSPVIADQGVATLSKLVIPNSTIRSAKPNNEHVKNPPFNSKKLAHYEPFQFFNLSERYFYKKLKRKT
jgi:hypothetical protein